MDILLYLTELLKTRKTIGIVGLGTLYKKKSPGYYDSEKHAFMPPSFKLAFTSAIQEQDELAHYISSQRSITTESATYYISEFVSQTQAQLSEHQEADLGEVGKLKLVNDEITLIPNQADTFSFEYYGLPEVKESIVPEEVLSKSENNDKSQLENIEQENKIEEENPGNEFEEPAEENVLANETQEVYEETLVTPASKVNTYHPSTDDQPVIVVNNGNEYPTEEVEVAQEEYIDGEETKQGMPFFIKFLISFLTIVALGAIVYFINPRFFNNYFNKNSAALKGTTSPMNNEAPLTVQVDSPKTDSLTGSNAMVTLQKETSPTIDSSKVTIFEVLVSAVATDKKADKIVANLNSQGVKARKIKISRTMINISAGSFLTEESAKNYRDSLRITLKNQGIYIQPIKPKK